MNIVIFSFRVTCCNWRSQSRLGVPAQYRFLHIWRRRAVALSVIVLAVAAGCHCHHSREKTAKIKIVFCNGFYVISVGEGGTRRYDTYATTPTFYGSAHFLSGHSGAAANAHILGTPRAVKILVFARGSAGHSELCRRPTRLSGRYRNSGRNADRRGKHRRASSRRRRF